MNTFTEISVILLIATLISFIMRLIRQPLVVGYILSGILVGPYALNILQSAEYIELLSKIGITVLLFIVGIGLNPFVIREVGKVSLVTGIGQVVFTSAIGYFIIRALGYDVISAIYIAIALTFSSTIIILKLLSDRGDLQKLYGKIAIGFLLVQDVIATLILLVVSTLEQTGQNSIGEIFVLLTLKALAIGLILFIVARKVLPKMTKFFAQSQELLFVFSITWGLCIAAVFQFIGFSIEIGALVAGVALSISPFAYEIASRMRPLRDFFILLFFITLGSHVIVTDISTLLVPALILSAFVLIGNPLIVLVLMNMLGYKRKVGFMAGLAVAQISEFSLILASVGLAYGHISQQVVSLITLVGIITIAGSTYLIMYADPIYNASKKVLALFDIFMRKKKHVSQDIHAHREVPETILFGYDKIGHYFIRAMKKMKSPYLVVDFNPKAIHDLQADGIPFRFGDAEDVEFLEELDLAQVKLVVSTIPNIHTNMTILQYYKKIAPHGLTLLIANDAEEAKHLYLHGASYVVIPRNLGAHHASQMITKFGFDPTLFDEAKEAHLAKIE